MGRRYSQLDRDDREAISRLTDVRMPVRSILHKRWSPEQIAGRMRHSGDRRVCHETIYRYVYGEEGKQKQLYQLLPWSRRRRRPRGARKPRGLQIPHLNCIGQRPPTISEREDFGHWAIS